MDDGVELLSTLRSLTQLNLQECWQVTDRGLEHLSGVYGSLAGWLAVSLLDKLRDGMPPMWV